MIAQKLYVLMTIKHMNIQQLHEQSNISRPTISSLLNGHSKQISFHTIEALCRTLGVAPDVLFSEPTNEELKLLRYSL